MCHRISGKIREYLRRFVSRLNFLVSQNRHFESPLFRPAPAPAFPPSAGSRVIFGAVLPHNRRTRIDALFLILRGRCWVSLRVVAGVGGVPARWRGRFRIFSVTAGAAPENAGMTMGGEFLLRRCGGARKGTPPRLLRSGAHRPLAARVGGANQFAVRNPYRVQSRIQIPNIHLVPQRLQLRGQIRRRGFRLQVHRAVAVGQMPCCGRAGD